MMCHLWCSAANVEDLDYPDEELDIQPIVTCVRCQSLIYSGYDEPFCADCYDYLDERGYFEP